MSKRRISVKKHPRKLPSGKTISVKKHPRNIEKKGKFVYSSESIKKQNPRRGYQHITKEHFRDEWRPEALSDKVFYEGKNYRKTHIFRTMSQAIGKAQIIDIKRDKDTLILRDGYQYKVFTEE